MKIVPIITLNDVKIVRKNKNNIFSEMKIFEYIHLFIILIHFCIIVYLIKNKKNNIIFIIILNIVMVYLIFINCIFIFSLNKKSNMDFSCGGDVINGKINYFINNNLFSQNKSKLFIFAFLVIIIIELVFQNVAFYIIKKSHFKRLYIKTDIF